MISIKRLLYFFLLINTVSATAQTPINAHGLKEIIGQMIIVGFDGSQIDDKSPIAQSISKGYVGGVILFDYNFKTKHFDKNIKNPQQIRKLTQKLQYYAREAAKKNPYLPLFIGIDYEGGKITRLKEKKGFPKTISAQKMGGIDLAKANTYYDKMGKTLEELGINLDFAPVLDVSINPNNPVIAKKERSFSNDVATIIRYAGAFVEQLKKRHIFCAFKHFPGHGSSKNDSHDGFVDVTETWKKFELEPYEGLLKNTKSRCDFVMSAHIVNKQLDPSGLPATLSKPILTDLLRKKLGFDGIIITDDMQMKAITDTYGLKKAVTLAINAGADILVFGNQLSESSQSPDELASLIMGQVLGGEISIWRIYDAYDRITKIKQKLRARMPSV